jgi:amino acid transporter
MTALMPVNTPVMEFPRRFLDRGVGLAVGWMYWFSWTIGAAGQLVAVSQTIKFKYNDGKTHLHWDVGEYVDSAIWVSIFLVLVIALNMLPVKVVFNPLTILFLLLTAHDRFTDSLNILLDASS